MKTVVLYSREGCCLCDQARAVLTRVRASHPFVLEERDIDSDDSLLRSYLERIPVVTIDGAEVFEFFVDESRLARVLSEGTAPAGTGRAWDPHSAASRVK